jgi:hypothetical protein
VQRPQTKPKTVKKLGDELKELRRRYAKAIKGLRRRLKRSGVDDPTLNDDVVSEYAELVQAFETGSGGIPFNRLNVEFHDAVFSIPGLLRRINQDLVVRSVKSERDQRSLEAFRQLPFVENSENYLRNAPFETLDGLDAVIALLSRRRSGTAASDLTQEAASRRNRAARATKEATKPPANAPTAEVGTAQLASRRREVDDFITKVLAEKEKIRRKDICKVAGYKDNTEFERYQRGDPRTTAAARKNFDRVLKMTPNEFIACLEKKQVQK